MKQLISKTGVGFGTSGARGLVSSMTDELCYAYTKAFLQAIGLDQHGSGAVVIGHDLRPSSPKIASACVAAIRDTGLDVVYAGALPTPALAWRGSQLNAPVVVVTGSHIPFDRNGIKFYRADGEISKSDEHAIHEAIVEVPDTIRGALLPAPDPDARSSYVGRYLDFFGRGRPLQGMKVGVYDHSSVGRDIIREILEALGSEVISLGRTETFVPIDTEAVRDEDARQARLWADQYLFDAILSTDGDADRPLIGDESGSWLRGDMVGNLTAKFVGANIVVTPVNSNSDAERCAWFKTVLRTRIGSPFVIAGMLEAAKGAPASVVVGYEANGGFLLGTRITLNGRFLDALPTRDAVLPMLSLLVMAKESGEPISALRVSLPGRQTASHRLQDFPSEVSRKIIESLAADTTAARELLAPGSGDVVGSDQTDGLRLSFASGDIVHLRPSGNAPELRCYAESSTKERADALSHQALSRILLQAGNLRS